MLDFSLINTVLIGYYFTMLLCYFDNNDNNRIDSLVFFLFFNYCIKCVLVLYN